MKNSTIHHRPKKYTVVRIVDIENLAGGSKLVEKKNETILAELRRHSVDGARELTAIAVGVSVVRRAPHLLWSWQGMRTLVGAGLDGADIKLAEVLESDPASQTAQRIEIWSGDHHFSALAKQARSRGAEVHVFARPSALSKTLGDTATQFHPLFEQQKSSPDTNMDYGEICPTDCAATLP